MHKYRTHKCGNLNSGHIGEIVKITGWVHRKRNHGSVQFVDLRDHYGIVQLVSYSNNNSLPKEEFEKLANIANESVITVMGEVVQRTSDTINENMSTGTIEVTVKTFTIESEADIIPISVNSDQDFPEELRLKYRFLDLRRNRMHNNVKLRSYVIRFLREEMWNRGFEELQTPILTASSPEGARDFIVPSRLHAGKFYALPQAPQQFKQLYMIAGFDKYFQIAPCFRDEDARADRAPGEFYQLDIEMSFVTQEDIFNVIEPILYNTFKKFSNKKISKYPFEKIPYKEAIEKYGSDKPDLRNPIVIIDVTDIFRESSFKTFKLAIEKGHVVKAIPIKKNDRFLSRGFYDKMTHFAQYELKSKGLAYITINQEGESKGPISKFLSANELHQLQKKCCLNHGDTMLFVCDTQEVASINAGKLRTKVAQELDLIDQNQFHFCWIVDYPLYTWDKEQGKLEFFHNPFSMPQGDLNALDGSEKLEDKLSLIAYQYDIICNGIELSSGAIRNHKLPIMYKVFKNIGYSVEKVNRLFPAMVKGLKYGAPPHGGIAPGIDRIVMLLAEELNIRETIAFPLNQSARDLLMDAPSPVETTVLDELCLSIKKSDKLSKITE